MSKLEAEYSSRKVTAMHLLDGDFKLLDHAVTDEAGIANVLWSRQLVYCESRLC